MIDFSKLGTGNTVDNLISPREIFTALPNKNTQKFQYPRDVQSQVWNRWYERRNENNLVIKMNTGSGKTVVGLMLLKSCLNEGKGPAVYICPDNYLINQVESTAMELGLEVTKDQNSPRFLSGKSILIINIHKLINGQSVFGVGDEGIKINITSMVIDDAHACLDTVEEKFTLNIPSDHAAYLEIYNIIRSGLENECESKTIEIESGDPNSFLQLPYWVWKNNLKEINKVLHSYKNEDFIKFVWPLLKENLNLCDCVVNSNNIEISAMQIPIHMVPVVSNVERKVFMTASLIDDSILSSHFSIPENEINKPIIPDTAGDVGDRMILFPQVINSDTTDDQIKHLAKHASQNINVVVIVPSAYRANYWRDVANLVLDKYNLNDGVERLKNELVGLTVLVNRYDGVDLPGDACRFLIIDGVPDVRRYIDKVKQSTLTGTSHQSNQLIQRIEQGMGRGVRSNDDYCVVFLMGRSLTSQFYANGAINKLSPGTRQQVDLSEELSNQVKGKNLVELWDVLKLCWLRDQQWVSASKGVLAKLQYDAYLKPEPVAIALRDAYNKAIVSDFISAARILNEKSNSTFINNKREKGYLKQICANYTNNFDQVEAQKIQKSAISDNNRLFKPIAGFNYIRNDSKFEQAVKCLDFFRESDLNKLLIQLYSISEDLVFKKDTADRFEEAFKKVSEYIGFSSQRPENDFKKGPDILWNTGDLKYFVIEAKNGATTDTINKHDCNQLNGSCEWFETKYDKNCAYIPIMIHPSNTFEYACSPNVNIRIMNCENLKSFVDSVIEFMKSIASIGHGVDVAFIRERLNHYNLRHDDIINKYTISYKINK
tara:strand:+ start:114 stop:2600 length:2487 start_codon:yes stop_codon:yes gene_type:complete